MTAESPWTYTLCDMRTDVELAVLPLTSVRYSRAVRGGGKLDAFLHLADDKIRAMNPWRATRQRRVTLYAEYRDKVAWAGPVMLRSSSSDSQGFDLSAVTFDGWLHRQRLLTDLDIVALTMPAAVSALVARAQALTDVGLTVDTSTPGYAGIADGLYLAQETKPIRELIDNLATDNDEPMEWWIDVFRDPTTRKFKKVIRVGLPRIGRRYEDAPITFAYPDGGLVKWKFPEDGSGANNVLTVLGSGSGRTQPFDILTDTDIGTDEIASGFPSWMDDFRASDTNDLDLALNRGRAAMRSGLASEAVFTGVELRPDLYLGQVNPGDDVALEITHLSQQTWPKPVTYLTRVLGESVVVGDGGKADKVSVTIGGAP